MSDHKGKVVLDYCLFSAVH